MGGRGGSSGLSGKITTPQITPFEMPTIRGSEKQIKWVKDMFEQDRKGISDKIERMKNMDRDDMKIYAQTYVDVYTQALNDQAKALKGKTIDAKTVIDNRSKFLVGWNESRFDKLIERVVEDRKEKGKLK